MAQHTVDVPNQVRSRFDFRCLSEGCGLAFPLELTKQEFIDNDVCCPSCKGPVKRALFSTGGIPAGGKAMGMLASYPYYNSQLPVLPGQKPGEQMVMSRQHENEIMRGAWGNAGQRYERNAL